MSDERLLERIKHMETRPGERIERNLPRKTRSIMHYLQRLLNTRQGSVLIADDFGIPDITNTSGEGISEITERIEKNLRNAIQTYEPRLDRVKVTLLSGNDDVLTLRFKLEAVIRSENNLPLVLETVISSEGKVNVIPEGA